MVLDCVVSQRDYSGSMGFNEFKELWAVLNQWKSTFSNFDRDRSGTVEPQELQQALVAMGTVFHTLFYHVLCYIKKH